jgi:hypothetical protein
MNMNRVIGVSVAAGCAALAITACGTGHVASGGAGTPSSGKTPTVSATPQQRANADATSILASFVPPPGAVRLSAAPPAAAGALRTAPGAAAGSPDVARDTSWWRVPGSPQQVLAWEKAHLPSRFTMSGHGTSGSPAQLWQEDFALPAEAGVLPVRGLTVNAVDAGGGQAALRVDAQVVWVPAKPVSEQVLPAAKVVTISAAPGLIVGAKMPAPVTISNAATVQRIGSLVDGLPVFPSGRYNCPADVAKGVRMTFRASAGGSPVAVVTAGLTGCQGVNVIVGGKPQPSLANGAAAARQVLSIAGLRWTGYGGGSPMPGGAITPGGTMQHN